MNVFAIKNSTGSVVTHVLTNLSKGELCQIIADFEVSGQRPHVVNHLTLNVKEVIVTRHLLEGMEVDGTLYIN